MSNVIIIGAGAAGMMAAYAALSCGHKVIILEKNEKCGKKIYITGKGRCNLANDCDAAEFFDKVVSNPKFLFSSIYTLTPEQTKDLFQNGFGLPIKTERGGRMFPVSDKSSDVIKALEKNIRRLGADIKLNTKVINVSKNNDTFTVSTEKGNYYSDAVIIATGGLSYPSCGSTGDGYNFAGSFGHKITKTYPALVPLNTKDEWPKTLSGLALRNISVKFVYNGRTIYEDFGEMLFTHFGVSGPVILSASSYIAKYRTNDVSMFIDCKPALTYEELERRIERDFLEQRNVHFSNSLRKLFPSRFISIIVGMSGIDPDKPVKQISRQEICNLAHIIKNVSLSLNGTRDYNEAIITGGGVNIKEINPSTMESKLVKNLYFAGEMIDVDAVTGGYNLQIAWSTGYTAGINIQ